MCLISTTIVHTSYLVTVFLIRLITLFNCIVYAIGERGILCFFMYNELRYDFVGVSNNLKYAFK